MAALAICEIDNVLVEVSGPELPIMDGSAQPFVFLIECAGDGRAGAAAPLDRGAQAGERRQPTASSPDSSLPTGLIVDCAIHFEHPLIDSQALCVAFDPEVLQEPRSPAPAPSALPSGWRSCGRAAWRWAARSRARSWSAVIAS